MIQDQVSLSPFHLARWLVAISLFVICGCAFASVRARHAIKQREIRQLIAEEDAVRSKIREQRAMTMRFLTSRYLEGRLEKTFSPLAVVGADRTERLAPTDRDGVAKREPPR